MAKAIPLILARVLFSNNFKRLVSMKNLCYFCLMKLLTILLFFSVSAAAQVDTQYIYNQWVRVSKWGSDAERLIPYDAYASNPSNANEKVLVIEYTRDFAFHIFWKKVNGDEPVKYITDATWKWVIDSNGYRIQLSMMESGSPITHEKFVVSLGKDEMKILLPKK